MKEYTYNDISINDTIITKDNIKGTVIQINSILYLNQQKSALKNMPNYIIILDEKRTPNYNYNCFTLLVQSPTKEFEPYFLSIDFSDIKTIIKNKKETLLTKIKNIFV